MRLLIASLALPLMACTPDTMLMTNPNASLDLMAGTGAVARSPSGETTFRFVIPENAYARLIPDPTQQRAQDQQALAQWIGKQGVCPSGYNVNPPINVDGMLVYEGVCQ
jgi:heat shock protein HslJ